MVDFTSTQAHAKEVAPPASCKGGQDEATTKPLNASPPLTADGVDKMYHQLAEIHAIIAMQLAECARWHRSDSTASLAWAGIGRPRPVVTPSMIRLAPSPLTDFSSQAPPWQRQGQRQRGEPQVHRQARQGSAGTLPKCHVQSPRQGGHNDLFRSTFEEPHGIATQRTTSCEATMLCPALGSREATPSNDKLVSSDVATHYAQEGVKGDNKRHK
jgi:hypothetical protein